MTSDFWTMLSLGPDESLSSLTKKVYITVPDIEGCPEIFSVPAAELQPDSARVKQFPDRVAGEKVNPEEIFSCLHHL